MTELLTTRRWRDKVARELDEGVDVVMNKMRLFALSLNPPEDVSRLGLNGRTLFLLGERTEELMWLLQQPVPPPPPACPRQRKTAKKEKPQRIVPVQEKLLRVRQEAEEVSLWLLRMRNGTVVDIADLTYKWEAITQCTYEASMSVSENAVRTPCATREETATRLRSAVKHFKRKSEAQQLAFVDLPSDARLIVHKKCEGMGLYHNTVKNHLIVRKLEVDVTAVCAGEGGEVKRTRCSILLDIMVKRIGELSETPACPILTEEIREELLQLLKQGVAEVASLLDEIAALTGEAAHPLMG